jgi:hypothetical protein
MFARAIRPLRLEAIGRGYVSFARTHPDLFLLMFRSERLDFTRPALRSAADAALDVLAGTVRAVRDEPMQATLTLPQAAQMVVAWSLVHGFAMLLLDDRLKQLIAKLPPGVDEMVFLPAILSAGRAIASGFRDFNQQHSAHETKATAKPLWKHVSSRSPILRCG